MSCVVLPRILRLVTRGKGVKRDSRDLLPPDDSFGDLEASATSIESMDKPLVACRIARHHPYGRRTPRRLLLARENFRKECVRVLLYSVFRH